MKRPKPLPKWVSLLSMGAMYAADLFGMALFQLMQVRLSAVDGTATQIIMMLTSMSYMPGIGIALVAHAAGACSTTTIPACGRRRSGSSAPPRQVQPE